MELVSSLLFGMAKVTLGITVNFLMLYVLFMVITGIFDKRGK